MLKSYSANDYFQNATADLRRIFLRTHLGPQTTWLRALRTVEVIFLTVRPIDVITAYLLKLFRVCFGHGMNLLIMRISIIVPYACEFLSLRDDIHDRI